LEVCSKSEIYKECRQCCNKLSATHGHFDVMVVSADVNQPHRARFSMQWLCLLLKVVAVPSIVGGLE